MQKTIITGNLGADPAMRYTPSGVPITSFSVATNRRWTDKEGQQHEKVVWYRVSAWRKLGELCNQYLSKGRKVLVEGELEADPETGGPRIWEGKDGKSHASFELNALSVEFLGGAKSEGENGNKPSGELEGVPATDEETPF